MGASLCGDPLEDSKNKEEQKKGTNYPKKISKNNKKEKEDEKNKIKKSEEKSYSTYDSENKIKKKFTNCNESIPKKSANFIKDNNSEIDIKKNYKTSSKKSTKKNEITYKKIEDKTEKNNKQNHISEIKSEKIYKNKLESKNEENREITKEEGEEFASVNGMDFFETSAKTDYQVQEAFIQLTRDIIKTIKEKKQEVMNKSIKLKPGKSNNILIKKKKCCE